MPGSHIESSHGHSSPINLVLNQNLLLYFLKAVPQIYIHLASLIRTKYITAQLLNEERILLVNLLDIQHIYENPILIIMAVSSVYVP
jgi:hypothetical protein